MAIHTRSHLSQPHPCAVDRHSSLCTKPVMPWQVCVAVAGGNHVLSALDHIRHMGGKSEHPWDSLKTQNTHHPTVTAASCGHREVMKGTSFFSRPPSPMAATRLIRRSQCLMPPHTGGGREQGGWYTRTRGGAGPPSSQARAVVGGRRGSGLPWKGPWGRVELLKEPGGLGCLPTPC